MEETDLIREQIAHTRSSLSDKLETLEDRVSNTVQETSNAVDNVTNAVEDTVTTVSDSVQETVTNVKDTVDDTITVVKDGIDAVKGLFDIPGHVDRHPWLAVGGSLAAGYVLAEFLSARHTRPGRNRHDSAPQSHAATDDGDGNGEVANANRSIKGGGLLQRFEPELSKLTGLALGVLMGTIREMVANAAGESLGESLCEIIDSVTEKIGGTLVPHEHQPKDEAQGEHGAELPARPRSEAGARSGESAHMTA